MKRLQQATRDTTMPSAPDLSLAPEPPPPKSRATPSAPSMDKHTRNYFKRCGGGPTHCSSMALGAEGVQKEPMEVGQKEAIKSNKTEGLSVKVGINVDKNVTMHSTTKKNVEHGRDKDSRAGNPKKGTKKNEKEDWHDALDDFGETMIRKSTVKSKESLTGRRSAPGSPRLERIQVTKVSTSGSQPTTPTNQEKRMTSPVPVSSSHGPDAQRAIQGSQYKLRREKSTGFLNIFRWFRNRDKKKHSASMEQTTSGGGSQNSLSSAASSIAYYPITKSKSAECPKRMTLGGGEEPCFGLTRRYNLFKHSSSESSSRGKRNVARRSASAATERENRKSTISSSSTISHKKRPAPQPPGMGDSVSVSSETSFTSLSGKEAQHPSGYDNVTDLSKSDGQKLHKAKSEGLIYTRAKRRAPMPPDKASNQAGGNSHSQDQGTLKKQGVCSTAPESQMRPVSNISSVSSFSPSQSSTIKSLSSNSFTTPSATSSQYSSESIRLESGFLKQDLPRSQSSSSVPDTSKVTLSPRPWYKRKKSKDSKDTLKHERSHSGEDKIYDTWMPDIQFVRGKFGLRSDTPETVEESTHSIKSDTSKSSSKKVKEEEKKEKRKSQVSLLASISELDRAAAEHIEREHQIKKAEKEAYDNQFYSSSLHILTQNDVSNTERVVEQEKATHVEKVRPTAKTTEMSVCEGATATLQTQESSKRSGQNVCHDDKTVKQTVTQNSAPYTENPTLKITESTTTKTSEVSKTESFVRSYFKGQSHKKPGKSVQSEGASALPTSDTKHTATPSPPTVKKDTPMQKAVLDAEMFYRLAKDMQGSPKQPPKLATPPSPSRRNPPEKEQEQPQQEQNSKEPEESLQSRFLPKPNRNFGFRMNHLFSPEVSTILEASETMTSTATTPADDLYEDILSSIMQERRANSQEDLLSEINSEYRLDSTEAREIMQEIANVQREIAQINMEEDQERLLRDETRKADRIREEILLLRERNNFEAWNSITQRAGVELSRPPAPIDIINSSTIEHKKKWVCDVCTLINLPWRLQCEACGTRRPFNPKRVGNEVDSSQAETDASQTGSLSDSSCSTVLQTDSRSSAVPQDNPPLNEDSSKQKKKQKKGKNWEQELQTYFRSFESSSNTLVEPSSSDRIENEVGLNAYSGNKEKKKCKKNGQPAEVSASISSENTSNCSQEVGFFASRKTELSNKSKYSEQESLETASGRVHFEHKENETNPSLDEIRRVRLARFLSSPPKPQENHIEFQNAVRDEALSPQSKRKAQAPWSRSTSESGESTSPNAERRGSGTLALSNSNETQKWVVEQASQQLASLYENSNEKNFYKKEYQKSPVLKTSGAVKNAISIFNQMDEINSVVGKPKQNKRRSVGAVLGHRHRFEQLLQESSPEVERNKTAIKEAPRPQNTALVGQRDGEIASAIAKFDSLVAIAESEKVAVAQANAVRSRVYRPNSNRSQSGAKLPGVAEEQGATLQTSEFASWDDASNSSSAPGVIKDGVLYTSVEQRPRSLSVSSGTFELIGAKDFETIEAHHKEYFPESPTEEKEENSSASVAGTTNGTVQSCHSSSEELSSHFRVESSPETPSFLSAEGSSPAFSGKVNEIQGQCDEAGKNGPVLTRAAEAGEVEKLCRQLTEAEGIATFKANLRVAEPEIGQMNTMNINRLLKRLEGAITRGNHAEASRLAHDLAELRISCSVVRNPKVQGGPGSGQANGAEQKVPLDATPPTLSRIPEDIIDKSKDSSSQDTAAGGAKYAVISSDVIHSAESTAEIKENSNKVKVEVRDTQHKTGNKKESNSLENGYSKEAEILNQEVEKPVPEAELNSGQGAIPKQKRETKISIGRREVKSDTISKLPDAPQTMMIEEQACVPFNVQMYVEDKTSHQGPISITVVQTMTVGDLRAKVEKDFGFPPEVQRWILGRRLANDDDMTLEQHKVTTEGCPVFLYLVAPESGMKQKRNSSVHVQDNGSDEYSETEVSGENIHSDYIVQRDSHGHEQYRFYNPDTYSYEMSLDICDDRSGEKEEEERLMRQEMEDNIDNAIYENASVINAASLERENGNQVHNSYPCDDRVRDIGSLELSIPRTSLLHSAHVQEFEEGQPIVLKPKVTPVMQNENPTMPLNRSRVQIEQVNNQVEEQVVESVNGPLFDKVMTGNNSATNENWVAKETEIVVKKQQQSAGEKQAQSFVGQPQLQQQHYHSQPQQELQPSQQLQTQRCIQPQEHQTQTKLEQPKRKRDVTIAVPVREKNDPQVNKENTFQMNSDNVPQTNKEKALQTNEQNPHQTKSSGKASASGWVCPSCTLVNPWTRPGCEACATERPQDALKQSQPGKAKKKGRVKKLGMEMSALEQQDIVANQEDFECRVCFLEINGGEGVVLRDCLHTFCRECLANAIKYSETADVKCPYRDNTYSCPSSLQDREIRALVTAKQYEKHLSKSVKQAEGSMQNVFHCKTPDCPGFCQFEDNVNVFTCDVCHKTSCLTCQAQHMGMTCKEYQERIAQQVDEAAMKTKKFFDDIIRRGDGLPCPKCSVMLVRKWGCDWMRCPMCRTEICWVTRGPRWGPGGQGDTSGGCRCGINGRKCHPKCTYCH